jgi:hypothetical protein
LVVYGILLYGRRILFEGSFLLLVFKQRIIAEFLIVKSNIIKNLLWIKAYQIMDSNSNMGSLDLEDFDFEDLSNLSQTDGQNDLTINDKDEASEHLNASEAREHLNASEASEHLKDHTERLICTLENHVMFLEEELRRKNDVIDQLLKKDVTTKPPIRDETNFSSQINLTNCSRNLNQNGNFSTVNLNDHLENTPLNKESLLSQLLEIRKQEHQDYVQKRSHGPSLALSRETKKSSSDQQTEKSVVILGDSMLRGINEKFICQKAKKSVKIKYFSGATIKDIRSNIKDIILDENPSGIILHVGTNNAVDETSNKIYGDLMSLRAELVNTYGIENTIVSIPTIRSDHGKAALTISKLNKRFLDTPGLTIVNNENISYNHLGQKGLHLNKRGKNRFSLNIVETILSM